MVEYVEFKDEGGSSGRAVSSGSRVGGDKVSPQGIKRRFRFSWKLFFLVFFLFLFLSSLISSWVYDVSPKVGVVPISGVIMTEEEVSLYGSSVSSRRIAETIYSLGEDSSVKAIVLDINSPGGSPVASEEISRAIFKVRESGKPVYTIVSDLGASGAFWVGVSGTKFYASSMSILGSIGVTSAGFGFEDLLAEYNVSYRKITAGEFKDIGTSFRAMTEEETEIIQDILDEVHENFILHVAKSRNLSVEEVRKVATGEIFLGSRALKLGFVDELGVMQDLVDDLRTEFGAEILFEVYGPEESIADLLGLKMFGGKSLLPEEMSSSQVLLK